MNDCNFTKQDREAYPLTCSVREELCAVSDRYAAGYAESAKSAPSKLEKRAASISLNMAKLTKTFLCCHYVRVPVGEQTAGSRRRLEREGLYESLIADRAGFDALTEDERAEWIQFAGASFMLRRAFIEGHLAKLSAARKDPSPGAAEQLFESRIVLGTLYAVLREWRAIRAEKGLFPLDRWTYEDEPWAGEAEESDGD